jgi:peroxiredoxin
VGKPAPDFYAETIDGHAFKLSDYKGKVVLLDFYGFW